MPVIPKIAGTISLVSTIKDIHNTGMIYSKQEKNKSMGNNVLSSSIGNQKADYISLKDAKRKNWTERNMFFSKIKEDFAVLKGYIKGTTEGVVRYAPKFVLALAAIIPKNKGQTLSYLSTVGLGIYEIWDYLRHGTGLFERTDYLERK